MKMVLTPSETAERFNQPARRFRATGLNEILGICCLQNGWAERIVDNQSPLFVGIFTKNTGRNRFS